MQPHQKRLPQIQFDPGQEILEMPLWLLPDIAWFQESLKARTIVVNDTQKFEKQTPFSRYAIGAPNTTQWLSIPIDHSSRGLPLNQTHINYQQNWIKDHKQAWQTAYGKTPFYEYFDYRFFEILDNKPLGLADLSWDLLLLLHKSLQLPNTLIRKSTLPEATNQPVNIQEFTESTPPRNNTVSSVSIAPSNTSVEFQQAKTNIHEISFFTIPYNQVFQHKHGFRYPLSAIDYLFQNYPNF